MPKLPRDTQGHGSLEETITTNLPGLSVTTQPVMIVGVQRKLNTGNYENVDIYAGLALPLGAVDTTDFSALQAAVAEAAELGFALVSEETGRRYRSLKELQAGRPTPPA